MKDLRVSFPEPCSEKWDDMAPRGCNRFCGQCERTIFDLSALDIEEVEAMLASEGRVCVRARIDNEGVVELKSRPKANARRMILAVGASVGMLMTGAHATGKEKEPRGEIAGKLDTPWPYGMAIIAKSADGKEYRGKVKAGGGFKIKKLPPGTYSIGIKSCSGVGGDIRDGGTVVVRASEVTRYDTSDPHGCLTIGMIEIDQNNG
jgi:hypothetical protein